MHFEIANLSRPLYAGSFHTSGPSWIKSYKLFITTFNWSPNYYLPPVINAGARGVHAHASHDKGDLIKWLALISRLSDDNSVR